MPTIDLNCDLGEGGPHDADIMPWITSANVGCGQHAGDERTSLAALHLARQFGVRVGAHPGFADRANFGRVEIDMTETDVDRLVHEQTTSLLALAKSVDIPIAYVKPHGALYHQASRLDAYARPMIRLAEEFKLAVVGLPGTRLEQACRGRVRFVREGFADRRYLSDGSLVPRGHADALIHDADEAVAQAQRLIAELGIETLCVHGDNPSALVFVRALRESFQQLGIKVEPFA